MYYSVARWYDAASGRFMTEDNSASDAQTLPQSLDRYIYADDNPMKLADNNGEWPLPNPQTAKHITSPNPIESLVANQKQLFEWGFAHDPAAMATYFASVAIAIICPYLAADAGAEEAVAALFTSAIEGVSSASSLVQDFAAFEDGDAFSSAATYQADLTNLAVDLLSTLGTQSLGYLQVAFGIGLGVGALAWLFSGGSALAFQELISLGLITVDTADLEAELEAQQNSQS